MLDLMLLTKKIQKKSHPTRCGNHPSYKRFLSVKRPLHDLYENSLLQSGGDIQGLSFGQVGTKFPDDLLADFGWSPSKGNYLENPFACHHTTIIPEISEF